MTRLFAPRPNIKQLVAVAQNADGSFSLTIPLGSTIGAISAIEVQNPANGAAVYTIPAGKTFNGLAIIVAQFTGVGTVSISAATGGVQASVSKTGASAGQPDISIVPVILVGGTGNAVTVATSGVPSISTVALVGHVA